ncbi:hypothetical protein D3C86_1557030 [compost metagenome]
MVEQASVGGEVGARSAANWLLIDLDQPPDAFEAADDAALGGDGRGILERGFDSRFIPARRRGAERAGDQFDQRLADQAGFSRA